MICSFRHDLERSLLIEKKNRFQLAATLLGFILRALRCSFNSPDGRDNSWAPASNIGDCN